MSRIVMEDLPRVLLIRGARVICPSGGIDEVRDLFIEDGVVRLAPPERPPDGIVRAEGLVATPGFIEIHAHLRDPGYPDSETIESGLSAALAGGFTAVFAMANTRPPNDSPEVTQGMLERARASGLPVRLYPVAAATVGLQGLRPADYPAQKAAGAAAISDDGIPVMDDAVMAECMAGATAVGLPILDHATHGPASAPGVVHDGAAARARGLAGLPREEEDHLVARNIRIAEEAGDPIHIQHLSTGGAVSLIREARARGVAVTAEAAPHHLILTDEAVEGPDHKMNPPLREEEDRLALVEALLDGTVDAIATDHAPHAPELKAKGIARAPFGIIGMESAFPVVYTRLVRPGLLGLQRLVELLTTGPAAIGRVPGGALAEGSPAELNLIDLTQPFTFDESLIRSRSRNCPFLGWEVRGRILATVAGGRMIRHEPERIRSDPCSRNAQ